MAKKNFEQTTIVEKVDCNTGEVQELTTTKTFTIQTQSSDEFYMTFIEYSALLFQLKSEPAKRVLAWMCNNMEYNKGTISIPTKQRKQLCEELQMDSPQLTHCIKKLKDLNILTGDRGFYTLNPLLFWKGTLTERGKLLKAKDLKISFKATFKESQD